MGKDALFFSAKLPGGYGGYDIYLSYIDKNDKLSKPINIGSKVNTTSDEVSPFYDEINCELYFSSNGHIGVGGYDIFRTIFASDSTTSVQNLGIPINSIKDDLYLSMLKNSNGDKNIYFSSDRDSECCLQLYRAKPIRYYKKYHGSVKDCSNQESLTEVIIELYNSKNKNILTRSMTITNGEFEFMAEKDSFDSIV